MPEFFASHVPARYRTRTGDFARFMTGYLETAEWLWPDPRDNQEGEGIDRAKVRGWAHKAVKAMHADCRDFFNANRADLAAYVADHGWNRAGGDFFLSREGHGAGYFDRGAGPVGDRLQAAAEVYGEYGNPWLPANGWVEI